MLSSTSTRSGVATSALEPDVQQEAQHPGDTGLTGLRRGAQKNHGERGEVGDEQREEQHPPAGPSQNGPSQAGRISPTISPPPSSVDDPVRRTASVSTPGSVSTPLRARAAAISTGRTRGAPSSVLSAKARPSASATA